MSNKRGMTVLLAAVLALGLLALPGIAVDKALARDKTPIAQAGMIASANAYLKNDPIPVISAADVFGIVQSANAAYQIVDVRSAAHYALGHIDGAINIPFSTIADDASLARLDKTKTIVVVCYTGETSSMTTMVWSMLGYDARALMFGMSGWNADPAVVGIDIWSGVAAGYPTVTQATMAKRTFRAPKMKTEYASADEAIKGQTKAYFAEGLAPVMTAAEVHNIVVSKDRHYQIVSVRQPGDYASGHIDGAINIVWTDIADQMTKLDPKKTTIVYCYTGNIGAEAAMFLNLMGYRTYNMMSGMSSWNNDASVGGFAGYDPAAVANYSTVK